MTTGNHGADVLSIYKAKCFRCTDTGKVLGMGMYGSAFVWPTPTLQDSKNATLPPSPMNRDHLPGALMREGEKGQLNPIWVCWLMGWPLMWTGGAKSRMLAELPKESQTEGQD